jgi:hypothetical protein
MNDPEGFLSRWARRKSDAGQENAQPDELNKSAVPGDAADRDRAVPHDASEESANLKPEEAEKEEPAFDLSKLPSIESITAETDIRPFLTRGVPADLRQAALRRAWVADPHIRDFIGIAENQGDFTAAGDMPGFDFSPPTGDIARMIAEIFGETRQAESTPDDSASGDLAETSPEAGHLVDATRDHRNVTPASEIGETPASKIVGTDDRGSVEPSLGVPAESRAVRQTVLSEKSNEDGASQNDDAMREEKISPARRSHGGAMPK